MADGPVIGWGCKCGFTTDSRQKFMEHLRVSKAREPDGHESIGRLDLLTGEILLPPMKDRTPEQNQAVKEEGKRKRALLKPDPAKKKKGGTVPAVLPSAATSDLSLATQVRFVPRIFTCNLTPTMLLGYEVALTKWGWREDMPFENFLDSVIYHYFLEHGTKLVGAISIMDEEFSDNGHDMEGDHDSRRSACAQENI